MKKTAVLIGIILLSCSCLQALNIKGNNLIWSPVSSNDLIYSVYGKSSGTVIWKLYHISENDEETIFYGNSLVPLWSYDGKNIVFTRKESLVLNYSNKEKEIKVTAGHIATYDISLKSDKILYSDNEKIFVCELKDNNNYFFANGSNPLFVDNDKKVIFCDENLKANIMDQDMNAKVLFTNIVKKIIPVKSDDSFLFLDNNRISLYDLSDQTAYPVVDDESEILDFQLAYDPDFLTYQNNQGKSFMVHIPTRLKVLLLEEKGVFSQKLSRDNRFCAFEKNNLILINNIEKYTATFNLNSVYRISLGEKDGLNSGVQVEVYEEKKNPFTQKVIGYDENGFKGVLKIITVFKNYSYGLLEKDLSTDKIFQKGDAVLWKEKNALGTIE
ncbi:MAG: hypothetical protein PHF84_00860 [bacterium]|nr:hypothetical protein [bacterium]